VNGLPSVLRARRQASPPRFATTRSFCWDTGTAQCWRTTLTVQFQPAGLDIDAGRYLPNRYQAVLSNSRLPATTDHSAAEMMPFDLLVVRAAVSTPTPQALNCFANVALKCLRRRYLAGDPGVCGYFAGLVPAGHLR
jgi:hypothetical protein